MSDSLRPSILPDPISVVRPRPGRRNTGLAQCHLVALGSLQRAKRVVVQLEPELKEASSRTSDMVAGTIDTLDKVDNDPEQALRDLEFGASRLDELRNHLVVELALMDEARRVEDALDELHAACDGLARALRRASEGAVDEAAEG